MLTGQNVWRSALRNLWNSARQGRNGCRLQVRRDRGVFSAAGGAAEVPSPVQLPVRRRGDTVGNGSLLRWFWGASVPCCRRSETENQILQIDNECRHECR